MARRRRKFKISGDEYTFGGGASSESVSVGTLKIARGNINTGNVNHIGFVENGAEWTVTLDAGTAIESKDQYVYFDNAFETNTGAISIEYLDGDTALAAGLSFQSDNDSTDTDVGYGRIYGTPSTEGTNRYKIKYDNTRGDKAEVIVSIKRYPQGTTPVWSSTSHKLTHILRNTAGAQVLADGPTTTWSVASYRIKDISGFAEGVTPVIDAATGQVTVSNIGDIEAEAAAHQYTVVADLGSEIGTFEQTFTGDISYGDPYGAAYFGPANAKGNRTSGTSTPVANASISTYHNMAKSSGALRRLHNARQDTSPYLHNDGYGCEWENRLYQRLDETDAANMSGYAKFGYMGPMGNGSNYWSSSSNHQTVRYLWEVPAGVTSLAMVCVGGGGPGAYNWSADGGGGAGLAWMNGVSVTPGDILEIGVGLGRYSESNTSSYGGGNSWVGIQGGQTIIFAQGGGYTGYSNSNPNNRTFNNYTVTGINQWNKGSAYNFNDARDGGGWGANSSLGSSVNGFHYGGGVGGRCGNREGAGAGGYRGGTNTWSGSNAEGQYGGGGNGYDYSSTYGQGGGGGTGLDGQGWQGTHTTSNPRSSTQAGSGYGGSGSNWTSYNSGSAQYYGAGGGGSGGARGNYGQSQYANYEVSGNRTRCGGLHGGGGGGSGTSQGGGNGAPGGVRIIWGSASDGTARSFPYTYCSEKPSMQYNGES